MSALVSSFGFARARKLAEQRTRAGILRQAARACETALAGAGVRALVVGSVAYGAVRPESDLDLLIVSYAGRTWGQVRSPWTKPPALRRSVDVIFADTLPPAVRRRCSRRALRRRLFED